MRILWRILQGIGIIIAMTILYLALVAILPGFTVPKQPLQQTTQLFKGTDRRLSGSRRDVSFEVKGTSLSGWLYLPKKMSTEVACIVMGNGLGGTKDMGLEDYAIRFQKAGFAALLFDYRHFGGSEGEPRQLIWIPHQLEDWKAAINYARSLKEIDPARIALWGTSMSGGHVIVIAAKDNHIACVSAQCPGLDGRASAEMVFGKQSIGYSLRMIMHGQRDLVRSWFGLSPHKIPIVGKPGSIALMATSDAYDAFGKLVPENFINEACARIILRGDKYRPVEYAQYVRCPVLLQICDRDSLLPISAAEETSKILGKYAEVKNYPINHFDIYMGDNFEKSVSDQIDFFKKHL
jgi:fermentation-respiration switch protein FrsA (DUF1100 family)